MRAQTNWHSLHLHEAKYADAYKDTARIHESCRDGVRSGGISRLYAKGASSTLVAVRGLKDAEVDFIRIDEATRERLGLSRLAIGSEVEVRIRGANLLERLWWGMSASDPAARISMKIAVWSLFAGLIGLFLGIVSLFR